MKRTTPFFAKLIAVLLAANAQTARVAIGLLPVLAAALCLSTFSASVSAKETQWLNAGTGSWFVDGNWDNGVPADGDTAYLDGGTTEIATNGATAHGKYVYIGNNSAADVRHNAGNADFTYMFLAEEEGSSGTYELTGDGYYDAGWIHIGGRGTGQFIHSGGELASDSGIIIGWNQGYLAYNPASSGRYELSGSAVLSSLNIEIGPFSQGEFNMTGGTAEFVNFIVSRRGTVSISGGDLTANLVYLPYPGVVIEHSGGRVSALDKVDMGYQSSGGDPPKYVLSGNAELSAVYERIGRNFPSRFDQMAGTNTADYLAVRNSSTYNMHGGTLNINRGALVDAHLDFGGQTGRINIADGAYVNLAHANIANGQNASVIAGNDTLVVFPSGFDPGGADLGSYATSGRTHVAGNTFQVAAGQAYTIFDEFTDHVEVAGTFSGEHIGELFHWSQLTNGLKVLSGGTVDGIDSIRVDDTVSTITGGSILNVNGFTVGPQGKFRHVAGDVSASYIGVLGDGVDRGTYVFEAGNIEVGSLQSAGHLQQVGGTTAAYRVQLMGSGRFEFGGTGRLETGRIEMYHDSVFEQAAGEVVVSGSSLGQGAITMGTGGGSSRGTYLLKGGSLETVKLWVGHRSTRWSEFTQTGGRNTVHEMLTVGSGEGSKGRYELSGTAELFSGEVRVSDGGNGQFIQTGGLHTAESMILGRYKLTAEGLYEISGGHLDVTEELTVGASGDGIFKVIEDGALVEVGSYLQNARGTLISSVGGGGLSAIHVVEGATLDGTWIVENSGAGVGRFDVIWAEGGISGQFSSVVLPDAQWSWGINDGTTLYVQYVPEPSTLILLTMGAVSLLAYAWRRRRKVA